MKTLTKISNTIMEKYLPDPYIFVTILTVLVLLLGVSLTDSSPIDMVTYWGGNFWGLLAFTMQMDANGHCISSWTYTGK